MRHPLNRFRVWLGDNDPFLRLTQVAVYVLIGGAFAVYIGWQQTRIADQQTKLAEHQLAVSREQLKVAAAQAEIARANLIPRFEFVPSAYREPPQVVVRSSRSDIHDLTCSACLFIEREQPDGSVKRVRVTDFFASQRMADGVTCRLSTEELKNRAALLDFRNSPDEFGPSVTNLVSAYNYDFHDSRRHAVHCFFELRYFNAAKELITDRYVTVYPAWRPRPVITEPNYGGTVNFADYRKKDGGYDFKSLYSAIDKVIGPPPTRVVAANQ